MSVFTLGVWRASTITMLLLFTVMVYVLATGRYQELSVGYVVMPLLWPAQSVHPRAVDAAWATAVLKDVAIGVITSDATIARVGI